MNKSLLSLLAACVLLGGCTSANGMSDAVIADPIEPANRKLFSVHQALDKAILRPVAKGYGYLPSPLRTGVSNALSNLGEPFSVANQILQADMDGALDGAKRFLINSTIGVLGFMDVAESQFDIAKDREDLGQTLAVWGVPEGAYLVVPVLGPTSLRDLTGRVAGVFLDPANIVIDNQVATAAIGSLDAVDTRQKLLKPLDDLERTSLDYYTSLKSAYWQRRTALIGQ